jgi:hypothetical protein
MVRDDMRFFFFGLLRDAEVLGLVTGRPWTADRFTGARLAGARLVRLRGETFPMLVAAPGVWVPGVLVEGLTESDLDRIGFFESVEYQPATVEVELRVGGRVEARAFATTLRAVHDEEPWSFEIWRLRDKARALRETELWMALYGHLSAEEADRRWDAALAAGQTIEELVREVRGASKKAAG